LEILVRKNFLFPSKFENFIVHLQMIDVDLQKNILPPPINSDGLKQVIYAPETV
jgi:hypothetical protein